MLGNNQPPGNESHANNSKKTSECVSRPELFYKGLRMIAATGVHDTVIKVVAERLDQGAQIIEMGAGTGAFTLRLLEKGYRVTASGIEPNSFALAEVPYLFLDLNKELSAEHHQAYEAAVAVEVIEHLENVFDFFRKVYLMLKPGGWAFITTPNILNIRSRLGFFQSGAFFLINPKHLQDWGHIQVLPPWLLQAAAQRAGLNCQEIIGLGNIMEWDYLKGNHLGFVTLATKLGLWLKKLFYQESFPGEFSGICIMVVLQK